MAIATCPCCHNTILRHLRGGQLVWFCRTCWQEMPSVTDQSSLTTPSQSSLVEQKRAQLERGLVEWVAEGQRSAS